MMNGDAIANRWYKLLDVEQFGLRTGSFSYKRRTMESYALFMIVEGTGILSADTNLYSFAPDSVMLSRPGQHIWIESEFPVEGHIYVFHFEMEQLPDSPFPLVGQLQVALDGEDFTLCAKIANHWKDASALMRMRSQAAFQELLCSIAQSCNIDNAEGLRGDLARMKLYMERHYAEDITIEQLADRINVSARHFRRLFKEAYKISATEYLTEQRIKQAKHLIASTEQHFGDIALQVGYQNENHFRRMFKQQVGMPPAIYIRNRKLKVGAYSWPNVGQLLPLNVVPHAAPVDHYWTDHYKRKLSGDLLAELAHDYDLNRKLLQQLQLDYIIGIDSFMTTEEMNSLRQVAPSYFVQWEQNDWRKHLLLVGKFLDRTAEAERWLGNYEAQAAAAAKRLGRMDDPERLLIVLLLQDRLYRWNGLPSDDNHEVFAPRRSSETIDEGFAAIAVETLPEIRPRRIVVLLSENTGSMRYWRQLQSMPEWNALTAVKENNVFPILIGPPFDYTAYNHGLILDQWTRLCEQSLISV